MFRIDVVAPAQRGTNADLAAASKATGQTMVWTGPELEAPYILTC